MEICEIQRSASTLLALLETQQRKQEEYKYHFAREQQRARDPGNDELAKAQQEFSIPK